jgi:carnitine 3-dehydrogenase
MVGGFGINRNLTFHLGGGEGGITHMLDQFKPAFEAWWASMSTPELSPANLQQIIDGVAAEARGRSIAQLAAERDAVLLPLLELTGGRS